MSRENELEVVAKFRNAVPHFYEDGELVYSCRNQIFNITDLSDPRPTLIGEIPWNIWKRAVGFRLIDRCLKYSILQVHRTKNREFLVTTGNTWWHIDSHGYVTPVERFGQTRPMNRGICESGGGFTYVAEYWSNPDRCPIRIFLSKDLETFSVAWQFEKGSIRHVHALIPDIEFENRVWVLTGDRDHESCIYFTDDEFSSLQLFLRAGQKSRATDMIIRDGRLYWGMDSPVETSFVYTIGRETPHQPVELCELPGPTYYMTQNEAGGIYLGTTVEPGPSVKDNYGHVFGLRPDNSWREILRRKNDVMPQFGIFYFPKGVLPANFIVFSQRGLRPNEGQLVIARDTAWG